MTRWFLLVGFVGCVPLGNWLIGNVGDCSNAGPCLVPVWVGLMAPSGVLVVGLALVLRDQLQEAWGRLGQKAALAAIAAGALMSFVIAPPRLALASGMAFATSEVADWLVYQPLRRRGLLVAMLASGIAGLVVDSGLFLWLAFGSLDFLAGQVVGKAWALLGACVAVAAWRRAWAA